MTSASAGRVGGQHDLGVALGRGDDVDPVVVGGEHGPQALDDDVVVVGQHDADGRSCMLNGLRAHDVRAYPSATPCADTPGGRGMVHLPRSRGIRIVVPACKDAAGASRRFREDRCTTLTGRASGPATRRSGQDTLGVACTGARLRTSASSRPTSTRRRVAAAAGRGRRRRRTAGPRDAGRRPARRPGRARSRLADARRARALRRLRAARHGPARRRGHAGRRAAGGRGTRHRGRRPHRRGQRAPRRGGGGGRRAGLPGQGPGRRPAPGPVGALRHRAPAGRPADPRPVRGRAPPGRQHPHGAGADAAAAAALPRRRGRRPLPRRPGGRRAGRRLLRRRRGRRTARSPC